MKRLWSKYASTFLSILILVIATIYSWYDNQSHQPMLSAASDPATEVATVERVIDGDTFELVDGRKVRYIGIDSPELNQRSAGSAECYAQEAFEKNRELLDGVTITLEKDVSDTDRYGRLLRYVWKDGELLNYQLVAEGYAVARSFPPDISLQEDLQQADRAARLRGLGLWQACE